MVHALKWLRVEGENQGTYRRAGSASLAFIRLLPPFTAFLWRGRVREGIGESEYRRVGETKKRSRLPVFVRISPRKSAFARFPGKIFFREGECWVRKWKKPNRRSPCIALFSLKGESGSKRLGARFARGSVFRQPQRRVCSELLGIARNCSPGDFFGAQSGKPPLPRKCAKITMRIRTGRFQTLKYA
jgi:hypothetical protein